LKIYFWGSFWEKRGGNFYCRGGQPAAQTRIKEQRFFDILGVFLQVYVIMRPKKPIILAKFSNCDPETNLGWPPLFY
jgi:hypothetical protein